MWQETNMSDLEKNLENDKRLRNEIEHGKYLKKQGAGDIWGWETVAGKKRWSRRVKMLTDHIKPGMNVLEIGCGSGYFTKELAKTNAEITAIDISQDLLDMAKEKVQSTHVNFLVDNAYDMNFNDCSFDTVVGSSVLHHLDIDLALKEIFRVLKPNGRIYFTEPNMLNPQIALQKNISFFKKKLGDSPDETAFFSWDIKRRFVNAGFKKYIEIVPFDFLHPNIPKSLVNFIEPICLFFEKVPIVKQISGSLYIRASK